VVLPDPVLGELARVVTGKTGRSTNQARAVVLGWADSFEVAENHCRLLISEVFQGGFVWHGVTVVDPFAAEPSPMLARLAELHPYELPAVVRINVDSPAAAFADWVRAEVLPAHGDQPVDS